VATSKPINESEIKKKLALEIPKYMIPSKIIFMEILPKNPNGKIDRNLLKTNYC
jgi:acyl-coenzyme A synthetase/AMP-(fatty) acid ligase